MKNKIERKLVANVIKDKCSRCEDILFSESWCTQERCIRFTLPIFRALFPARSGVSEWDSGDVLMFEVNNVDKNFNVVLRFSDKALPKEYHHICYKRQTYTLDFYLNKFFHQQCTHVFLLDSP